MAAAFLATLRPQSGSTPTAPASLLGHNLELAGDTVAGILPERLSNPTFAGPADPMSGIAPSWQPGQSRNLAGFRFDLTPGMGLEGREAQLLHNFSGRHGLGIVQTGRFVKADEQLEVVVWARAQHHPVTLTVGLRPWALGAPSYAQTSIPVTTTYWREYRATLRPSASDTEAVFYCFLEEEGLVWLDQIHLQPVGAGTIREDLREELRRLEIPVLRFPGGCVSTNYHWRMGTGPAHLRPRLPDPVFKWTMEYAFGTDEYLAMCLEMGIMPHITVNIGTGTPNEAGEWAAYCAAWFRRQGVEPPLAYWQMGNEHYGAWELGNMSGDLYAEALREFVPAVRQGYPNCRIIALGREMGEGLAAGSETPWRGPVLERAGDLIDLLALQWYVSGWDTTLEAQEVKALAGAATLADAVSQAREACRRHGLNTRVAVTEWNLWLRASHNDDKGFLEPYDVNHGLFVSAVLHHFARLSPDLELANFYHLLNPMGVFIARGPSLEVTPLAGIFRFYRPAFPGNVQPLAVEGPTLAKGVASVDALWLQSASGGWLFVTNRDPTNESEVDVSALGPWEEAELLVGASLDGVFTRASAECRDGKVVLPPLSIARLHQR